jgi:hypothetical protein
MPFPVLGSNSAVAGYEIDNSLRLNDNDSPNLSITPSSAGNRRTYTISTWVKRSNLSTTQGIFCAKQTKDDTTALVFESADTLLFTDRPSDIRNIDLRTNRLFRDSAWYHLVIAVDTTQGTNSNRVKIYVNGVQETSFSTSSYPSQNYETAYWNNTNEHRIGMFQDNSALHYDGYISEFNFIDGSQLAPTEFGETNDNGVWIPKRFSGSYGTNGFKLEFKNSGSLGTDTSGNGNNFTATNLTATDQTTDTPTNNFATFNSANLFNSPVLSEGNVQFDSNSSVQSSVVTTIAPSNGKWYAEAKIAPAASAGAVVAVTIGVSEVGKEAFNVKGQRASRPSVTYGYGDNINTNVEIDGSLIDTESQYRAGDIVGIALNLDDGEVTFYLNGTAINSGTAYNLHTNSTHENTGFSVQSETSSGNQIVSFNFGNPAFSISSGNSDANGFGNFEYAVPSGYYALCTKNLAEYG